jgi:hypothetical protein
MKEEPELYNEIITKIRSLRRTKANEEPLKDKDMSSKFPPNIRCPSRRTNKEQCESEITGQGRRRPQ